MTCPCQAAAAQSEALRSLATAHPAREAGRLRIDQASLRRALGGRGELTEALEVKATGRPGANVSRLWAFYVQPTVMRSPPMG